MEIGECAFFVSYDCGATQILLRGLPIGAAGGAGIAPIPGVELIFDRIDGRLAQVVVDIGEPGVPGTILHDPPGTLSPSGGAYVGRLLGGDAFAGLLQAPRVGAGRVVAELTSGTVAELSALSRLARLDATRLTSPVPASPLWAAEAAWLARHAGITGRRWSRLYRGPLGTGVAASDPGDAPSAADDTSAADWPNASMGAADGRIRGWLDPAVIPFGIFRHGLSPATDLIIRDAPRRLVVGVRLAGGLGATTLAACRIRLVDSEARRVLAAGTAAYGRTDGMGRAA